MAHQHKGFDYWLTSNDPALLWEMRTGKTLVAVRGTVARNTKLNLVAGPINVMDSWEKELTLEGERFVRAYACSGTKRIEAVRRAVDLDKRVFVLVNYEGFRWVPNLIKLPWGTVIADESVKIKNPQAQVTKLFMEGFRHAKHRAILTGLLSPESELDIFCQFFFLHGRFMDCKGSYAFWTWRKRYFDVNEDTYQWTPKPGVAAVIKALIHAKASVLRRADADMDKKKVYTTRTVPLNAEQKKLYDQIDKEFRWESQHYDDETMWATERAVWLRRVAGGFLPDGSKCISTAKPDEIVYLLRNDLRGESVIIWYAFRAELEHDVKYFTANGFKVSFLHGGLLLGAKDRNTKDFQSGRTQIMCCMEKLGDKGKDFSVASTAIYRSQEYSGDLRGQSEDRIIHPLKNGPLLYVDLMSDNTIDFEAAEMVRAKVFNAREVMTRYSDRRLTKKELFCEMLDERAKRKYDEVKIPSVVNYGVEYDPFAE